MKTAIRLAVILFLTLTLFHAGAQEYAQDFNRTDCSGVEHNLFSELDSGKVIILDFIMLGCAPCIWATSDLDTIVNSFADTHPGRVKIYSFSYENSFTCEQMVEWRTLGGFSDVTLFTQGAELVSYYGGMGMPTLVITGSLSHKVFYNGYGYAPADDPDIIAAVENALAHDQSGIADGDNTGAGFRVFPTHFSDRFYVETADQPGNSELFLFDVFGRLVYSTVIAGGGTKEVILPGIPQGQYFARLKNAGGFTKGVKLIHF